MFKGNNVDNTHKPFLNLSDLVSDSKHTTINTSSLPCVVETSAENNQLFTIFLVMAIVYSMLSGISLIQWFADQLSTGIEKRPNHK